MTDDHVGSTEQWNVTIRVQRDCPGWRVQVWRMSARTVVDPLRVEHGHYSGRLVRVVGSHFQAPLQRSERFVQVSRQCGRGQPVWPVSDVWPQTAGSRQQKSNQQGDSESHQLFH